MDKVIDNNQYTKFKKIPILIINYVLVVAMILIKLNILLRNKELSVHVTIVDILKGK